MTSTRLPQETARLRERPSVPTWVAKVVMAISGIIMSGFIVIHMVGNLKVYMTDGADHLNEYAVFLSHLLEPLMPYDGVKYIMRAGLLAAIILHMWAASIVVKRARQSRGGHKRKLQGMENFITRYMWATGGFILLFVIFHLLDLTAGIQPIAPESFQHQDHTVAYAYQNLIASFSRPAVALFYILAMVLLSLHILHGIGTAASDLGASHHKIRAFFVWIGWFLAAAILVGNASIPFLVMIGVLR